MELDLDDFLDTIPNQGTKTLDIDVPLVEDFNAEVSRLVNKSSGGQSDTPAMRPEIPSDNRASETLGDLSKYSEDIDEIFRWYGDSGLDSRNVDFMRGNDLWGAGITINNTDTEGYTFITRPTLAMTSANLRKAPELTSFDSRDPMSVTFAIRCLLDKVWAGDPKNAQIVESSPLVDPRNPFLSPLQNALTSISGFPEMAIATKTSEPGYMFEDQTVSVGGDDQNPTSNLSLSFEDRPGSPVGSIIFVWLRFLQHFGNGFLDPYMRYIDENRLCYTVSIYRFIMDSKCQYITKYAKATGCFPTSFPIGDMFNTTDGAGNVIDACKKFTIPFTANKIRYNNPKILYAFDKLVRRYQPHLEQLPEIGVGDNFIGLPQLDFTPNGVKIIHRKVKF